MPKFSLQTDLAGKGCSPGVCLDVPWRSPRWASAAAQQPRASSIPSPKPAGQKTRTNRAGCHWRGGGGTQKHLGLEGEREKNRKVCHRPGAPPPFPVFSFKLILVLGPSAPKSERPDEEEGAVWRKSESQSQSQEERHLYRLEVRSRWRHLKKKAFRTNRPTNPVAYSILLYAKIQGQKMSVAFGAPLRSLVYRRRQRVSSYINEPDGNCNA